MSGPYQLYRLFHDDGTSKSWAVRLNGDGTFTAVWGKTGNKMAIKVIEIDHPDKVQKLKRSKRRKGYVDLDIFLDGDGKLTNVPLQLDPVEPDLPLEDPRIYWTVRFINNLPSENHDSFKELSVVLKEYLFALEKTSMLNLYLNRRLLKTLESSKKKTVFLSSCFCWL